MCLILQGVPPSNTTENSMWNRGSRKKLRQGAEALLKTPGQTELNLTSSGWGLPMDLAYSRDLCPSIARTEAILCLPAVSGMRSFIMEGKGSNGAVWL